MGAVHKLCNENWGWIALVRERAKNISKLCYVFNQRSPSVDKGSIINGLKIHSKVREPARHNGNWLNGVSKMLRGHISYIIYY
jgi:hypothetical protein